MPATSEQRASHGALRSERALCRTARRSSCAPGALEDELAALAAEGVQSLLLEGGPTLATAFLEQGLVDKLLVFIAPRLAGEGPLVVAGLTQPIQLSRTDVQRVGDDVLLSAYVHEP